MKQTVLICIFFGCWFAAFGAVSASDFDGSAAYDFAAQQLALGPRTPGSEAHAAFLTLAEGAFSRAGWTVQRLSGVRNGETAINLILERPDGAEGDRPWIVLGAHYDSRLNANEDPVAANRTEPVPGGNDGASGVALLYGLAKSLDRSVSARVTLVLFDLEDQGGIEPYNDWCIGSKMVASYYKDQARKTGIQPDAVVILDMIGDPELGIYREKFSDPELGDEIWAVAAEAGYEDQFVNRARFSVYDDHIPFIEAGMRAVDLIDFDDPEWHTVRDDLSNVSQASLQAVGEVVLTWIERYSEKE